MVVAWFSQIVNPESLASRLRLFTFIPDPLQLLHWRSIMCEIELKRLEYPASRTPPKCPHCCEVSRHPQAASVVLVSEDTWICFECGCEFEEEMQKGKHPGTRILAVIPSDAFYG